MREYIENNWEIVEELLNIDNQIMQDVLTVEELVKHALEGSTHLFHDALLIYDGNPITTIKLMNSEITNCTLYPNHSYLGINRFLTSYKDGITLSTFKNDFFYEENQEQFACICLINAKEVFEEMKTVYKNIVALEI